MPNLEKKAGQPHQRRRAIIAEPSTRLQTSRPDDARPAHAAKLLVLAVYRCGSGPCACAARAMAPTPHGSPRYLRQLGVLHAPRRDDLKEEAQPNSNRGGLPKAYAYGELPRNFN